MLRLLSAVMALTCVGVAVPATAHHSFTTIHDIART